MAHGSMTNLPITILVPDEGRNNAFQKTAESLFCQDRFSDMRVIVDVIKSGSDHSILAQTAGSSIFEVMDRGCAANQKSAWLSLVGQIDTDYLSVLIPGDVLFRTTKLLEQVAFLNSNPMLNGCCSDYLLFDAHRGLFFRELPFDCERFQLFDSVDIITRRLSFNLSACCFRTRAFAAALQKTDDVISWWSMFLHLSNESKMAFIPELSILCDTANAAFEQTLDSVKLGSNESIDSLRPYISSYNDKVNASS